MTLYRPQVVSDYQAKRVAVDRVKWQSFRIFTVVATVVAGAFVAFGREYPGTTSTGRHVFSGLQESVKRVYEEVVIGAPPAAALPPAEQVATQTSTVGGASASSSAGAVASNEKPLA